MAPLRRRPSSGFAEAGFVRGLLRAHGAQARALGLFDAKAATYEVQLQGGGFLRGPGFPPRSVSTTVTGSPLARLLSVRWAPLSCPTPLATEAVCSADLPVMH